MPGYRRPCAGRVRCRPDLARGVFHAASVVRQTHEIDLVDRGAGGTAGRRTWVDRTGGSRGAAAARRVRPVRKAGARIEADKAYREAADAPGGRFRRRMRAIFERDTNRPVSYLERPRRAPGVVKASGLAAGKGVIVCDNQRRSRSRPSTSMMQDRRVRRRRRNVVVIEEKPRSGRRSPCSRSWTAARSGCSIRRRITNRWAKATTGPNTGGMGRVLPGARVIDEETLRDRSRREILVPMVDALRREDIDVSRRPLRGADADRRRPEASSSSTVASVTPSVSR